MVWVLLLRLNLVDPVLLSFGVIKTPEIRRNTWFRLKLLLSILILHGAGVSVASLEATNFSDHVAPIIFDNCVVCHREGGVAPFPLTSFDKIKRRAQQIAEVVESGFMPPWKPDSNYSPELLEDRSLTSLEVSTILDWVNEGIESGDLSNVPPLPVYPETWTLGEPDLVLEFDETYTLPAEGLDVYRNFVISVPNTETRFVRAVEFLPRSRSLIHHAVMQLDESSWSADRDEMDPVPGFDGMEVSRASNPTGQFIGWTPGRITYEAFEGTSWILKPGTDMIVQLHMLPSGKPEIVNPQIGLYYSDEPPVKSTDYFLLRANGIDIAAGDAAYVVEESLVTKTDVSVLGVSPHAHYLAKDLQIFVETPTNEKVWLLRIPDWDFNWQSDYRFVNPLLVEAGSRFVMRYTYDNSADNIRNPHNPPQRIKLGYNSTDEMGEAIIELLLNKEEDRAIIRKAQQEYEIAQAGGLAEYSFNLGVEMEELGRIEDAVTFYKTALSANPAHAQVLNNLGAIYETAGTLELAESHYRGALSKDPELHVARLNLARLLKNRNHLSESESLLSKLIEQESESFFEARLLLSSIWVEQGQLAAAIGVLKATSDRFPGEPYLNLQLGKLMAMAGSLEEAHRYLVEATQGLEKNRRSDISLVEIQGEANYILAYLSQQVGSWNLVEYYLSETFKVQPEHIEARMLSAAYEIGTGNDTAGRDQLKWLMGLPYENQPDPNDLLGILPFPRGTILLAKLYRESGQGPIASQILQQGLSEARRLGDVDSVNLFRREMAGF